MSSPQKLKINRVRGTKDLLFEEVAAFNFIENTSRSLASLYGFEEIRTPIFESTDVFHRTLGETSDAVNKETYTFIDRGGESLTLRPEGTAGIARAFISEGLAQNLPLKFFYTGPMFRYERPQKGRQRQFHQIGSECLGIDSPFADIEVILLAWRIINQLQLQHKCVLEINTLGDLESRSDFRKALVHFFSQNKNHLSEDSLVRLEKNPLRILDSKDKNDQKLIEEAPSFENYLNEPSRKFFEIVLKQLEQLRIPFIINRKLVRGLDYYTHTVFEFVTQDLGAQGTILAGGRYDGLIETMGGPKTSGVGWAAGIERLAELLDHQLFILKQPLVAIIPADEIGEQASLELAETVRNFRLRCEIIFSGNISKKIKRADKIGATTILILGSKEVEQKRLTVKRLKTGIQFELNLDELSAEKLNE